MANNTQANLVKAVENLLAARESQMVTQEEWGSLVHAVVEARCEMEGTPYKAPLPPGTKVRHEDGGRATILNGCQYENGEWAAYDVRLDDRAIERWEVADFQPDRS
jgi:hypothetical protein